MTRPSPPNSRAYSDAYAFVRAMLEVRARLDVGGQKAIDYAREWIDPGSMCAVGEHPLLPQMHRYGAMRRVLDQSARRIGVRNAALFVAHAGGVKTGALASRTGLTTRHVRHIVRQAAADVEELLARRDGWLDRNGHE